ncbi:MAG: hypothetical protein JNL83_36090 [Myxococcales bacterium]|nr:hypothetical protein [Myxococcales bacterium]
MPTIIDRYGRFVSVEATRLTAASTEGYVRYSFLADFEAGALMLVHVYPESGEQITGVHIRDAETGEVP